MREGRGAVTRRQPGYVEDVFDAYRDACQQTGRVAFCVAVYLNPRLQWRLDGVDAVQRSLNGAIGRQRAIAYGFGDLAGGFGHVVSLSDARVSYEPTSLAAWMITSVA